MAQPTHRLPSYKSVATDARFHIIQQQNKGAGAARNNGIEHAKGEYLYFMDCDDLIIDSLLQDTVSKAETTNADIVAFEHYRLRIDADGNEGYIISPNPNATKLLKETNGFSWKNIPTGICTIITPVPWNKLIRTSLVQKNSLRFLEQFTTNDIIFGGLVMACASKIVFIDKPYYIYRMGLTTSITSKKQNIGTM